MVQYLFKEHDKENLQPGLWHVKMKTNSSTESLFLKAYFLILPNLTPRINIVADVLEKLVNYQWKFEKLCWKIIDESKIDKDKLFWLPDYETYSCEKKYSYWSSFYPDPKSDLKNFI